MSTINTNTIDANYPIPGQNNSSQGFRDNFSSIKQNLDIASNEITDLQNKVVLKSALANSTLNNDMANTLISNASIQSFRHTMYNLGNALSGTVLVNASLADVHYGNVAANTTINLSSWAPVDTLQTIELQLGFANANAVVTLPANVQANTNNFGITLIENYANVANTATFTVPANCTQVNLLLSTTDCGATVYVEPVNRPYQSTQIQQRSPSPTGLKGDTLGTVAVDEDYLYLCTANYNAASTTAIALSTSALDDTITFDPTSFAAANINVNIPVVFDTMIIANTSVTSFGNINSGQFYYVSSVDTGNSKISISETRTGGTAGANLTLTTQAGGSFTSMDAIFYNGANIWKRVSLTTW
jgi:hypothetical protein